MDYGQFTLTGDMSDQDIMTGEASLEALRLAQAGPGIGKVDNLVLVTSPHQNNFAMPITVELWDQRPDQNDLDDWEEAFEVSLDLDDRGLMYDSPTLDGETVALPAGRYGIRIAGRGFVAHGWPGSTEPGDEWRWQVWPTAGEIPARRLRKWATVEPGRQRAGAAPTPRGPDLK